MHMYTYLVVITNIRISGRYIPCVEVIWKYSFQLFVTTVPIQKPLL
jgi:hypothetical protein